MIVNLPFLLGNRCNWTCQHGKRTMYRQVHLSLGKRHIGTLACHCRLFQTF